MAVLSGIGGAVNGISTVRTWTASTTADVQSAIASNTEGAPMVIEGMKDWTGNYTAYGHTPIKMPGETFTFTGSIDGTNGVTGSVICDSVEITWDQEGGGIIAHTVNFSGTAAPTLGAAAATDSTNPSVYTSLCNKVEIGTMVAAPVWTEITDVRSITLTITSANIAYGSSAADCDQMKRLEGNKSATVTITVYEDDFADLPAVNEFNRIRLYVDATTYWLIEFGIWNEVSDLTVDIEGPAVVPATLTATWTGFAEVDAALTQGAITNPAGTDFWPVP